MEQFLIGFSMIHPYIIYAVIVVLAAAEEPFLSMVIGVLIRLKLFSFWPAYAALMLGDLIGDVGWYEVGRHFGDRFVRRFGKYFSVSEREIGKVSRIFHKYKHRILFISKISNGFGFALVTLITAGIVRIPFLRYLGINVVGQFVWTGLLLAVGYYFSDLYLQVDNWLGRLSIIALFVILLAAFVGYKKYIRQQAEKLADQP